MYHELYGLSNKSLFSSHLETLRMSAGPLPFKGTGNALPSIFWLQATLAIPISPQHVIISISCLPCAGQLFFSMKKIPEISTYKVWSFV